MRLFVLAGFALLLSANPAVAGAVIEVRESLPSWAAASEPLAVPADVAGAVFYRRQDTEVHIDKDGSEVFTGYRVKLLHSSALQLGNLSIMWNPEAGTSPVDIRYRLDGGQCAVHRDDRREVARSDRIVLGLSPLHLDRRWPTA